MPSFCGRHEDSAYAPLCYAMVYCQPPDLFSRIGHLANYDHMHSMSKRDLPCYPLYILLHDIKISYVLLYKALIAL